MEETLFQLKFCSKQLARLSKKAEKEQKKEEGMIKKALTQGDVDRARIYAENAVRSVTEKCSGTVTIFYGSCSGLLTSYGSGSESRP
jgi:hypothetical protein